ncbi:MAG: DNA polymerase III subunit gamma/tau [Candidatus Omnitrophica bacterium]|nr:DNA polymerase III subunit gamma/tau [Candidatus Omnitrophota bacterium]
MSYTVFALKWRPKNFDEVVGQIHVTGVLKNAIQKNRLAHAYLFAGPRGVGKTSCARILAKSLNCKDGLLANPCQQCASCKEISEGRSLDVIEIDGASNRGIDEIRVLRENVKFAPTSGKFKIYIIDEVHMLTTEAFNALLKTLEEPPEFVKFIFATTNPNKVLPTILSRCQRFDFRRITAREIASQLERIVTAEKINVDKEVLFAIAKSSDGSLRDAESVLDQLVSFSQQKISLKDVISVLGLVEQEVLFEITERIIKHDPQAALALLNKLIDEGKDINVFLTNLIEHFRNLMIAKVSKADAKLIDLPEDICVKLLEQSRALSLDEIFSAFNILANTQDMARRFDSLRIGLEVNLVRLSCEKKPQANIAAPVLQKNTERPMQPPAEKSEKQHIDKRNVVLPQKESTAIKPRKDAPIEDSAADADVNITLEEIRAGWKSIVSGLSTIKMSVATYLDEGQPMKLKGATLTVSFPMNCSLHKEALESKDNRAIIEKALFDILKSRLRVNFNLSDEVVQEEEGLNHPFVKSALDMFNGRVVKEDR